MVIVLSYHITLLLCSNFLRTFTERLRLPFGPVRSGAVDHPKIVPGSALVRRRHRSVHQPRQRSQAADRVRRARRKAPVLGRQVYANPKQLEIS